jgi:site-specific DNA-methyltransferase (adenine-specific)
MTNKTDIFYDFYDELAMLLVEHLGVDYLEAFHQTAKLLIDPEIDLKVDGEINKKILNIIEAFSLESFSQEQIRLALELLTVKAYKAQNKTLDLMTPDTVNYIISRIINRKFANCNINILDISLGTSNMLQAIANNFPNETELIGIEENQELVKLASTWADLQNNDLKIYWQDTLMPIFDLVDIEIGDLDGYNYQKPLLESNLMQKSGISYYPYLAIGAKLENLKDQGYFFYLINNDFFSFSKVEWFKQYLQETATLIGLIVLPDAMFRNDKTRKSILIGKKVRLQSWDMMIFPIASLSKEQLPDLLAKLDQFTDKI